MIKFISLSFKTFMCFAILAGCLATPAYGRDDMPPETRQKIDSLKDLISSATGERKLDLYKEATIVHYYTDQLAETTEFLDLYIAEATAQENDDHKGYSICTRTTCYVNLGHIDSLLVYAPAGLRELKKVKELTYYFHVLTAVIEAHLSMGAYDEAMKQLEVMFADAKATGENRYIGNALYRMGMAYTIQGKLEEAITTLHEAIEVLSDTDPRYHPTLSLACIELSNAFVNLNRYDEALQACKRAEKALLDFEESLRGRDFKQDTNTKWFNLYLEFLGVYSNMGNHKEAEEYLRKLEENPLYGQSPYARMLVMKKKAALYDSMGRYDEAYDLYKYIYREHINNDLKQSMSALSLAVPIAYKAGRYKDSAEDISELMRLRDSLNSQESIEKLNDLRTQYEVDKLEAQKERQRLVIIFTGIGCILLAALALVYILYSRRLRHKNLALYEQIRERTRNEKDAAKVLRLTPETELSRDMKLYRQLSDLMENEKLFTNPALDRSMLASRLATNDKYLADAVREGADTTVATYISDYRLAYSLRLLSDNPDMPLDMIAEKSGHGSYSAFFRAFQRKYGMSPSDYRKLSISRNTYSEQFAS